MSGNPNTIEDEDKLTRLEVSVKAVKQHKEVHGDSAEIRTTSSWALE